MTWVAVAIGGSTLVGAYSANKAAKTQAGAADRAGELQQQQFERQVELQAPFREAGVRALPELEAASRYTPFGMEQFTADPGYGFRLSEGQKALDRQAAARGGLISGGALKAAQRYGQDYASQEFGNAYNRLAAMAGIGQTATGAMSNAAGNYGVNQGQNYMGAANARASGYLGGANAIAGGLGQYMNYTQGQNLLNRLTPQTGGLSGPSNAQLADQYYLNG